MVVIQVMSLKMTILGSIRTTRKSLAVLLRLRKILFDDFVNLIWRRCNGCFITTMMVVCHGIGIFLFTMPLWCQVSTTNFRVTLSLLHARALSLSLSLFFQNRQYSCFLCSHTEYFTLSKILEM
jgi:uncharacterized membrane protein